MVQRREYRGEGGGFGRSSSAWLVVPSGNGAELSRALTVSQGHHRKAVPGAPHRSSGVRRGSQGPAEQGPDSGVSPRLVPIVPVPGARLGWRLA